MSVRNRMTTSRSSRRQPRRRVEPLGLLSPDGLHGRLSRVSVVIVIARARRSVGCGARWMCPPFSSRSSSLVVDGRGDAEVLRDAARRRDRIPVRAHDQVVQRSHVGVVQLHVATRREREALLGLSKLSERAHDRSDLPEVFRRDAGAIDQCAARVAGLARRRCAAWLSPSGPGAVQSVVAASAAHPAPGWCGTRSPCDHVTHDGFHAKLITYLVSEFAGEDAMDHVTLLAEDGSAIGTFPEGPGAHLRDTPAPRLLLPHSRPRGSHPGDSPRTREADLARRLDQQLLRPPSSR